MRFNRRLCAAGLCLAVLLGATPAGVQETPAPVVVPHAEQFVLTAARTKSRYRILVTKPQEPPPAAGYPVIYVLDGNATFLTAAETLRLQTSGRKGYEPAVLVAIGYETERPFDSQRRYLDLTTPAERRDLPRRLQESPELAFGGAGEFLRFIEAELKPEIERRLPVDRTRQTLFGHSLGGFFVLHVLLSRPQAFSTYVAGSPSIWWNGAELLVHARDAAGGSADFSGRRLFLGIGAEELDDMVEDARSMNDILPGLADQGLEYEYHEFAGEEHLSVLPALVSRAIGFSLSPKATAR